MEDKVILGTDESYQITVPLSFSIRQIDGHLKDVLDIHKRFKAPYGIIVENLWGKIQYRMKGYTDHPYNPYPVFMKKLKDINIAPGESVDEGLYNQAFNSLSVKKPSHIINLLYYYDLADDASYEIHLALKIFLSMTTGNILIANPTPDTIAYIASLNTDNITISVSNKALAGILEYEFKNLRFIPYNAIGTHNYDAVLLFVRNEISSYNWKGFSVLNHVSDTGLAMISAPESIVKEPLHDLKDSEQEFDGSGPVTLRGRLDINSLYVESALLVPECLTQSHPKKKRILVCRKGKNITEHNPVQLFKASYEKSTEILTIPQFRAIINEDIFWSPKVSLSESYGAKFRGAHGIGRKKYTKQPLYIFSPEIHVRFQFLPGRRSKRVRASLLSHKTGKPIISDIEDGLSSSTPEQACQKIRKLLFQEDITQAIIFDLFSDTPMDTIKKYTLITLWFIHRSPLQDIPGYNDQFCINTVFSDEMRHLSSIYAAGEIIGLLLMLIFGLRNCETCPLTWNKIQPLETNPNIHVLYIVESSKKKSKEVKDSGKTKNFPRIIPIPKAIYEFLMKRKSWIKAYIEEHYDEIVARDRKLKKFGIDKYIGRLRIVCHGNDVFGKTRPDDLSAAGRKVLSQVLKFNSHSYYLLNEYLKLPENCKKIRDFRDPTSYLHIALANGRFCGAKRPDCGA